MKKISFAILIILSSVTAVDAQWYYTKCGVTDIDNCTPEEFVCLWEKASKNVHRGVISLGVGTTCIVTGGIVIALSDQSTFLGIPSTGVMIGGMILLGGFITDCIAIPTSVAWANRKAELRKTPNYKTLNLESLNIAPAIGINQFNNTHYLEMSISFNF